MDGQVCLEKGKGVLVTDRREIQVGTCSKWWQLRSIWSANTLHLYHPWQMMMGERRAWVGKIVRKKLESKYSSSIK